MGDLLNMPVKTEVSDAGAVYAWVERGGVELGFHPADDERNPRGGSPIVYWSVDDVDQVRERLLAAGCSHHRGPLRIEPGRRIAQLIDPFGTVIGIDGP
ncbi:VOC family protein [Kitasatospora sp. RG8]|uniref:VOC family protein n=1 Tax=Kitasatospora sp. RG8 TaxID=2820815 RepID=UPI001FD8305F|nr:VOC family protein [Kitasatospora sp. RG8]